MVRHVPFEQVLFKNNTAAEGMEQRCGGGALGERIGALFGSGGGDGRGTLIKRGVHRFQISSRGCFRGTPSCAEELAGRDRCIGLWEIRRDQRGLKLCSGERFGAGQGGNGSA